MVKPKNKASLDELISVFRERWKSSPGALLMLEQATNFSDAGQISSVVSMAYVKFLADCATGEVKDQSTAVCEFAAHCIELFNDPTP